MTILIVFMQQSKISWDWEIVA